MGELTETDSRFRRPGRLWLRPLAAAFLYLATAVIWFWAFERLAARLATTPSQAILYKGLVGLCFVIASAGAAGWLVWRELRKRRRVQDELRESQAQLARLVETAMDAIVTVDSLHRIGIFNPAAQRMFGCSVSEARGRDVKQFIPEFSEDTQRAVEGHDRNGRLLSLQGRRLDATQFPVEASVAQKEADPDAGYTLVVRDVTERLQLEEQLRRTNETLEQRVAERTADLRAVNCELESFCYSVAHDLRAPLRSIGGFTGLLAEEAHDCLNECARDYLARIEASTKRMEELIEAWLQLSRIARGNLQLETVDISAIASAVISELRPIDPARQVEFVCCPDLTVRGDPVLLSLLLQNLLGNAWKFTANVPQARIEFGMRRPEGGTPVYYVRDNGAGFDMKQATSLFQPFHRMHSSDEYEGTGIGLATCQKIVLRHNGCIWAEARVNHGTTIFFSFPERASVPDAQPPSPSKFTSLAAVG